MFLRFEHHLRNRLLAGVILLLPIGITLAILRLLFNTTAGLLLPIAQKLFGELPNSLLLVISFVTFVLIMYGAGVFTTNVIGRRLVTFGENIILRLPVLKTIYGASKQVVDTFAASNRTTFKSVVLLEFPRRGVKSLGFITGTLHDEQNGQCYKVFVPTTPNPTSGFFLIVPQEEIHQTSLSVEDGIKMIVSGGILSPQHMDDNSALLCQRPDESHKNQHDLLSERREF
jgi:uncharacterized membrane protein